MVTTPRPAARSAAPQRPVVPSLPPPSVAGKEWLNQQASRRTALLATITGDPRKASARPIATIYFPGAERREEIFIELEENWQSPKVGESRTIRLWEKNGRFRAVDLTLRDSDQWKAEHNKAFRNLEVTVFRTGDNRYLFRRIDGVILVPFPDHEAAWQQYGPDWQGQKIFVSGVYWIASGIAEPTFGFSNLGGTAKLDRDWLSAERKQALLKHERAHGRIRVADKEGREEVVPAWTVLGLEVEALANLGRKGIRKRMAELTTADANEHGPDGSPYRQAVMEAANLLQEFVEAGTLKELSNFYKEPEENGETAAYHAEPHGYRQAACPNCKALNNLDEHLPLKRRVLAICGACKGPLFVFRTEADFAGHEEQELKEALLVLGGKLGTGRKREKLIGKLLTFLAPPAAEPPAIPSDTTAATPADTTTAAPIPIDLEVWGLDALRTAASRLGLYQGRGGTVEVLLPLLQAHLAAEPADAAKIANLQPAK